MDLIKDVSSIIGLIISFITLITLFSQKFSNHISKGIEPTIEELKKINEAQNKDIKALQDTLAQNQVQYGKEKELLEKQYIVLQTGILDMLRQRIMVIYHKYREVQSISRYDREIVDQLYKDYKKAGGNSYIEKIYARIKRWEVIEDFMSSEEDD